MLRVIPPSLFLTADQAAKLNSVSKYVVSSTLKKRLTWESFYTATSQDEAHRIRDAFVDIASLSNDAHWNR